MSTLKFTLFRTFKNIVKDLMVYKYRFGKERCIKENNDIQGKNGGIPPVGRKSSCLKCTFQMLVNRTDKKTFLISM